MRSGHVTDLATVPGTIRSDRVHILVALDAS